MVRVVKAGAIAVALVLAALVGSIVTTPANACDGITLTMDGVEHCGTQPGGPGTDIVWEPLAGEDAEPVTDLTLAERVAALETAVAELQEAVGLTDAAPTASAAGEPTPSPWVTGGNE